MTNFEREEQEILTEAASTKKYYLQLIKDDMMSEAEGYITLNHKLVALQNRWFSLHRLLVEG